MKRFFATLGRFFWSWGFLKFILGFVGLVIFFYIEEDWRGARAWAATKAEWEARGESFDYNKFIPPPVPDDQNLAAIPLFKLGPAKYANDNSYLGMPAIDEAMHDDLSNFEYVPTGSWLKGELPDMTKIQKAIAVNYSIVFKGAKPPDDTLAQFNAIYPFFTDFLAAAATHPLFRINEDYTILPPVARPLSPITAQLKLSKILTLHAILALDRHQSDLALDDIKTNYKIASGVKRDPTLVGGLVAIGMLAINNAALYDGLAQHEWSDAQLIELEQTLKSVNFLADYQFALRSEVAQWVALLDYYKNLANRAHSLFNIADPEFSVTTRLTPSWPNGWWEDNKSLKANYLFHALANVDPKSRLVFPKADNDLQYQIEQANAGWSTYAPWKILANVAAGPVVKATQHFAVAQVCWIDEARMACALERYRLAHNTYPDSLDPLAPACIDELPHDIMNGLPYHYQLRPDGTYLLYSVGWNQTDDGGKVVFKKDAPTQIDYDEGDWVWPAPK